MIRPQDDTSQALLEAAHRLLASHGPDALTVRRIATEAGMSTMNVYSRFGGKDGVVDELYLDGFRRLFAALDAVPDSGDVIADLVLTSLAYRDFALANPTYYDIMFRGFDASQESIELALAGMAGFVNRLERGVEAGMVRLPEGLDPTSTTAWLWATCHGLVSLELDAMATEVVNWEDVFYAGMRTALAGLSAESTLASPIS